jgi:hypothetical protein
MNLNEEFCEKIADHLNRCRCCLKSLKDDDVGDFVKLNEIIQLNFYELTQIEVRK